MHKRCSYLLKASCFASLCNEPLSASLYSPFPQIISNTYSLPVWLFSLLVHACGHRKLIKWRSCWRVLLGFLINNSLYKVWRWTLFFLLVSVLASQVVHLMASLLFPKTQSFSHPAFHCEVNHTHQMLSVRAAMMERQEMVTSRCKVIYLLPT